MAGCPFLITQGARGRAVSSISLDAGELTAACFADGAVAACTTAGELLVIEGERRTSLGRGALAEGDRVIALASAGPGS
jgi:hypothetical protein